MKRVLSEMNFIAEMGQIIFNSESAGIKYRLSVFDLMVDELPKLCNSFIAFLGSLSVNILNLLPIRFESLIKCLIELLHEFMAISTDD